MLDFGSALRATRRGIHQYDADWRTAVICDSAQQVIRAYHEAFNILEAGSLKIENGNRTQNHIQMEKGGIIKFYSVPDLQSAYLLAGTSFAQLIYMFTPTEEVEGYLRSVNRSSNVPTSDWRIDFSSI